MKRSSVLLNQVIFIFSLFCINVYRVRTVLVAPVLFLAYIMGVGNLCLYTRPKYNNCSTGSDNIPSTFTTCVRFEVRVTRISSGILRRMLRTCFFKAFARRKRKYLMSLYTQVFNRVPIIFKRCPSSEFQSDS